ncbi:MAG: ATP-binding cassette domain-containing protein [Pirellulales bacterium]
MSRVVLQHVDKSYPNGVHAARDLNFEVAPGELFVLVGPSGCGKTTTLRLIAGLEDVTRGEIFIDDRAMNHVAPSRRDVAMVFQNAALYPHMSVRQNMAFALKMRRATRSEIDRRVQEAADALSIVPLLDRRPAELSGGERRRVAIGRAIVRSPKVFLLDEPLSDLDPPLRAQLRAEFAQLRNRLQSTIIYVTHDQSEAMTLGDRIAAMQGGAIRQIDTPANLYRRPASAFVASFIGSPGMNLIAGEVHDGIFRWPASAGNGKPSSGAVEVGPSIPNGAATLGIRPSDLTTGGNGPPFATVAVELIERVEHNMLIHFQLAGGPRVARLPADAVVHPRDEITLSLRPEALHLFATPDGRRLN